MKKLLVVIGSTCVGKTKYAIELAQKYNTEIVSFDSRQLYLELNIGVARPSDDELSQVRHHFIANKSIFETFNAHQYSVEANKIINNIFKSKDYCVLVGGSGLYLDSILWGFEDIPSISIHTREKVTTLLEDKNNFELIQLLNKYDPKSIELIDTQNKRRVQKVLEIYFETNQLYSNYINKNKKHNLFEFDIYSLNLDRNDLYSKINKRVEIMANKGLEQEVYGLKNNFHLTPLNTVGYKEWVDYFDNKISIDLVIDKIKQHTRNYAKRQITWNKKYIDNISNKIYNIDL